MKKIQQRTKHDFLYLYAQPSRAGSSLRRSCKYGYQVLLGYYALAHTEEDLGIYETGGRNWAFLFLVLSYLVDGTTLKRTAGRRGDPSFLAVGVSSGSIDCIHRARVSGILGPDAGSDPAVPLAGEDKTRSSAKIRSLECFRKRHW